jgi:hypothetical protein
MNPDDDNPNVEHSFTFSNMPVTYAEILDSITELQPKKSQDFNGISMFFLKKSCQFYP